jgi:acetolactate synthase I/II/III large subunit
VLVGSKAPVAFFAYPDRLSMLSPPQCETHRLATPGEDIVGALEALAEALAEELGALQNAPVQEREKPALPSGEAITPDAAAAAVGTLLLHRWPTGSSPPENPLRSPRCV